MKINSKVFRRFIPAIIGLFVLPFFVQSARANTADFGCSGTSNCNGTITDVFSGGVFVSAHDFVFVGGIPVGGITVVNGAGPAGDVNLNFTFFFDTAGAVPNIALFDTTAGSFDLAGTILNASGIQNKNNTGLDEIDLTVLWTTLSSDFAAFLGSPSGIGLVDNIIVTSGGAASDVTVTINPTPEPGSLLLLGSGLLGVCGFLRRRIFGA